MRLSLRAPFAALLAALALSSTTAAVEAAPGLHGKRLRQPGPVPEFSVLNQAGEVRGPADLLGKPHVLWFYPMAGTPG